MRKTVVLILVSVLMVCLCSCGSKNSVPSAKELSPKQEETGYVVVKADREASAFDPSMPGWYFHTFPIGAARFVTNEIMP